VIKLKRLLILTLCFTGVGSILPSALLANNSAAITQPDSSERTSSETIPTTSLEELSQQMLSLYEQNRYEEAISVAQAILTVREICQLDKSRAITQRLCLCMSER
jgi:hypothetical protein